MSVNNLVQCSANVSCSSTTRCSGNSSTSSVLARHTSCRFVKNRSCSLAVAKCTTTSSEFAWTHSWQENSCKNHKQQLTLNQRRLKRMKKTNSLTSEHHQTAGLLETFTLINCPMSAQLSISIPESLPYWLNIFE